MMKYFMLFILCFLFNTLSGQMLYLGADLSYVNEMEDCGVIYTNKGKKIDPFQYLAQEGANLVRVRLWHDPQWTPYSDLGDVVKTIKRAKANGMQVLLDFHYSDSWADPQKQYIPEAWSHINAVNLLMDSLYQYTYSTLKYLAQKDLLPEMVQVGNEINIEILQDSANMNTEVINWERNIKLINSGIAAVNDISKEEKVPIQTMIHIAQPENARPWFNEAMANGIKDFDWIGLSYYPKWSEYNLNQLGEAIKSLKKRHDKRVMIVETAYPYTLKSADEAPNLYGEDGLIDKYSATPEGQLNYLIDLTNITIQGGGEGVIYWEPAWVSSKCSTPWGQGSHWENVTLFDVFNNNEPLPGISFFDHKNYGN